MRPPPPNCITSSNPTTPNITLVTTQVTTHPAATKPAAPIYPHPSKILNASRFCTATAHSTPLPTFPSASSYFQTTIRMGNNFMHELTKSAVLMLLPWDVDLDVFVAGVLLPEGLAALVGLVDATVVPPRWKKRASQRMERCCAKVVRKQRRR